MQPMTRPQCQPMLNDSRSMMAQEQFWLNNQPGPMAQEQFWLKINDGFRTILAQQAQHSKPMTKSRIDSIDGPCRGRLRSPQCKPMSRSRLCALAPPTQHFKHFKQATFQTFQTCKRLVCNKCCLFNRPRCLTTAHVECLAPRWGERGRGGPTRCER
jgi:hypothetical protein